VLARASREAAKTRDITGGLPRVAELFEARKPKDNAIIAKISGRVEFIRDYKAKRKIAIIPEEGEPVEYLIPKSKVIDVQEGDYVKKGDNLISARPIRTTSSKCSAWRLWPNTSSRKSRKSIACRA
jgi:DNA-directed RNA polymerase subunit beta'